jgi:aldehyde oxidoreductase
MAELLDVVFRVNGHEVKVKALPEASLLRFLRDELGLLGIKDGCSSGHCGACTVIIDGKATRSCLVRMKKANGAEITTIEGLSKDGHLHPIQQAFIDHGAVQCGFCTPGMIMTAKALLDENPSPSAEQIKDRLTKNRNLCRCTGYIQIIAAIQDAAERLKGAQAQLSVREDEHKLHSLLLINDTIDRVTGAPIYSDDAQLPGMLYGKILWAAYPHAEILSIDISLAEQHPGVEAVITARDIPGKNQAGMVIRDQPAIADKKTRYIGDSLAAVFAVNREAAEEAVKLIKVDYRPLPGVFSPEEAAKPDAPKIHEKGNLLHHCAIIRGDTEAAFKECAVVVEDNYTTPFIEHGFLEPESGYGYPEPDGGVTIKLATQAVFDDRTQLSEILAMPEEKIRVIQMPLGGAFGGKEDLIIQQFLALGALKAKKPVKITLTREESLRVHVKRHPAWMYYKTGADKNGKVLAMESRITLDTGAYCSLGIDVLENTVVFGAGPYYVPNLKLDGWSWYTNNVLAGAMRGFGVNQIAFALEQQMDTLARELKIDPFKFRLMNSLAPGLPSAADHIMEEGVVSIKETIQAAEEAFRKIEIPQGGNGIKIGVGVASAVKNIGFGHNIHEEAGAIVELSSNGKVLVKHSQHDYGQGVKVGLVQLAADELGVAINDIDIYGPDTALTPFTGSTTASRQTFLTGNALIIACRSLKAELFSHVAEILNKAPESLNIKGDKVVDMEYGQEVPLATLGEKFVAKGRYVAPRTHAMLEHEASHLGLADFESRVTHWCYAYNTQVAVVAVDTKTGEVKVLTVISANDVGKAISEEVIKGQIFGGVMMGVGFALSEEFIVENGITKTDSLHKIHMPLADMTPEIVPVIVEVPHPFGPSGAKGFAEAPSLATAPAIANAIYDAIGKRVKDLPANKKRMLEILSK